GNARFNGPQGAALDSVGNLYVSDSANHTIRKVTSAGLVTTLAGLAGVSGAEDGTTSNARFNYPRGLAADTAGNIYVADSQNHVIRKVTSAGVVTTVAGMAGCAGDSDGTSPGGGTNTARFHSPWGVVVDGAGNIFVADTGNHAIREIDSSGVVSTICGLGGVWGSADGLGSNARFNQPRDIAMDSSGNLYVVDCGNHTLRMITPVGTNWMATTIAGGATLSGSADGSGLNARFSFPSGLAINTAGAFTIADSGNNLIRDAGSVFNSAPEIIYPPGDQTVARGQDATFSVTASGSAPLGYQWRFYGTNLPGATGSSYAVAAAQDPNAGPYSVVVTNPYGSKTSSVAVLSLQTPIVLGAQPANQLAAVSNSIVLTVGISQGDSPAYQWLFNGVAIAGATSATLTLNNVSWDTAGTYAVIVSNAVGSVISTGAVISVEQAAFTFTENFESYQLGGLDKNTVGTANPADSNPWWAVSTSSPRGWITNANSGVVPHGGSQMVGATGSLRQDYLNLVYRFNAGRPYYGNFMCDWWFYDPFGTDSSGATNVQDYLALCQNDPVSATSDTSSSFTAFNQRMSLGAYNGSAGYNYSNYQARIINGTGGSFGSANSWYNTATVRSVGWHHARIVVGIPDASNIAPVSMYIDDMFNPTVTSPGAGTTGFNLIELNHSMSKAGFGFYDDDLTFRAANDPWIIEQPASRTVGEGQSASFATVAVGTAYQWQFNGVDIPGATSSSYTVAAVGSTNTGEYRCVISGANGTVATTPATLALPAPAQPGQFATMAFQPDRSLQLNMSGTPLTNYVLECSPDLKAWSPLATLSGTNGLFQYLDPSTATNSRRFYRLRVAP
ncbi:MAG TPA: hypothetical protein VHH88_00675, partial [Verrucomicrobiae bacterium]|nr:hypothetical protein [Verrucomicrobiae bacterium]